MENLYYYSLDYTDTYDRLINDSYNKAVGKVKVILSGNFTDVYVYEIPVKTGQKQVHDHLRKRVVTNLERSERKEEYQQKRGTRARTIVRRLAQTNFSEKDKFLTLTFKGNISDLDIAHKEFAKFIKRFRRQFSNIKYIAVPEFQERGAVHYHILINAPYIEQKDLTQLWGQGYVFIKKVQNVTDVGGYISKYMSKKNLDERLKGRKCYFTSKGLAKPITKYLSLYEFDELAFFNDLTPENLTYQNSYPSERNGNVKYEQYRVSRDITSTGGQS